MSTVEILDAGGECVGYGVAVSTTEVLTLTHVLQAACGLSRDQWETTDPGIDDIRRVRVRSGSEASYVVSANFTRPRLTGDAYGGDACLIVLPAGERLAILPPIIDIPIEEERVARGGELQAELQGYTSTTGAERRTPIQGKLVGSGSLVQFRPVDGGQAPLSGTSGTPVFDLPGRRIIGLYHWREAGATGSVGYVAPISSLVAELRSIQINDVIPLLDTQIAPQFPLSKGWKPVKRFLKGQVVRAADTNMDGIRAPLDLRIRRLDSANPVDPEWWRPGLVDKYGEGDQPIGDWLQDIASGAWDSPLTVLRAPGGAGKTNALTDILELSSRYHLPVCFADLRWALTNRKAELAVFDANADKSVDDRILKLKALFRDNSLGIFCSSALKPITLVLVDGLNETPDQASVLLRTAKDLTDLEPNLRFVFASRPDANAVDGVDIGASITLAPLSRQAIDSVLGDLAADVRAGISNDMMKLFTSPLLLFLARSVLRKSDPALPALASASDIIDAFFMHVLSEPAALQRNQGTARQLLQAVAAAAFEAYRSETPLTFARDLIARNFSDAWKRAKLAEQDRSGAFAQFDSWSLVPCDGGREIVAFKHQMMHDYLIAAHLAVTEAEWNDIGFDAATWRAGNSAPLEMAVGLVGNGGIEDFIRRVYDWHYPLLVSCIHQLDQKAGQGAAVSPISEATRNQIAAVLALKLNDPFEATRERARKDLRNVGGSLALKALELAEREPATPDFECALIGLAKDAFVHAPESFRKWLEEFCRDSLPVNEVAGLLASSNSLTGWTAANVMRRLLRQPGIVGVEALLQSVDVFLKTMLAIPRPEAGMRGPQEAAQRALVPRVAIRRALYVLGASPSAGVSGILMQAITRLRTEYDFLPATFFQFAIEDAIRSLLEVAGRNSGPPELGNPPDACAAARASGQETEADRIVSWLVAEVQSGNFPRPLVERIRKSASVRPEFVADAVRWEAARKRLLDSLPPPDQN